MENPTFYLEGDRILSKAGSFVDFPEKDREISMRMIKTKYDQLDDKQDRIHWNA